MAATSEQLARRGRAHETAANVVAVVLLAWHLVAHPLTGVQLPWWVFPCVAVVVWSAARADPRPVRLDRRTLPVLRFSVAILTPPCLFAIGLLASPVRDREEELVAAAATAVIYPLILAWLHTAVRRLETQTEELDHLARLDHLTGLANRRAIESALAAAMDGGADHVSTLCVALIDLDHFKRYNDTYGHAAGDALLVDATSAWSARMSAGDLLGRYGGEEFLLITARSTTDTTGLLGRMRADTPQRQSFSAGVALWDGVESPDRLISRADAALYEAKKSGRARDVVARSDVTSRPSAPLV